RRHVNKEETAAEMISRASLKLKDQLNLDFARDVDILLTNVTVLDIPFTGNGADIAHRLGMKPKWIVDVHNGGCVSFVFMMDLARTLMQGSDAKTALICNVANTGGRVFSHPLNRLLPQAAIPGDGCGVGYLADNALSPIKSLVRKTYGECVNDMCVVSDDGRDWWEPRETPVHVEFTERKLATIVRRGNRIVPDVLNQAIAEAGIKAADVSKLITNQPNPTFLRNWREAIQLPETDHIHTFPDHGNLFGAALPVSLAHAIENNLVQTGHYLLMGGFAHAGDYAGAAVIHWQAGA
ncbi:MAG TPA: 3-oxoacyl-[acyl-carrier-protein] synthase III C-terminal domain-containing protein, partial [Pseudomonadales bacterium]|nr:3-oxoacyl-[acyl-carrier-protein] synthase III C-terminal domain-containing protein [Pseudomonadales bacterium]